MKKEKCGDKNNGTKNSVIFEALCYRRPFADGEKNKILENEKCKNYNTVR